MNLYEKLLEMQKRVDVLVKDGKNESDKYDFASDENVLDSFRPLMDEFGLLLIPNVNSAVIHEGTTRSGTARYLTEVFYTMTWKDVESGESLDVPWYGQGVDLAGEKGVGKAATYAEKYFFFCFFFMFLRCYMTPSLSVATPVAKSVPPAQPRKKWSCITERPSRQC